MLGRIEAALGDEYKKQSMTELVATIQYGDNDGNTINYYILKTTCYEAEHGGHYADCRPRNG